MSTKIELQQPSDIIFQIVQAFGLSPPLTARSGAALSEKRLVEEYGKDAVSAAHALGGVAAACLVDYPARPCLTPALLATSFPAAMVRTGPPDWVRTPPIRTESAPSSSWATCQARQACEGALTPVRGDDPDAGTYLESLMDWTEGSSIPGLTIAWPFSSSHYVAGGSLREV